MTTNRTAQTTAPKLGDIVKVTWTSGCKAGQTLEGIFGGSDFYGAARFITVAGKSIGQALVSVEIIQANPTIPGGPRYTIRDNRWVAV